jgi:hypothetical protein
MLLKILTSHYSVCGNITAELKRKAVMHSYVEGRQAGFGFWPERTRREQEEGSRCINTAREGHAQCRGAGGKYWGEKRWVTTPAT